MGVLIDHPIGNDNDTDRGSVNYDQDWARRDYEQDCARRELLTCAKELLAQIQRAKGPDERAHSIDLAFDFATAVREYLEAENEMERRDAGVNG
jgi:hypothetical protein